MTQQIIKPNPIESLISTVPPQKLAAGSRQIAWFWVDVSICFSMFLLFHSGVFSGAKAVSFWGCEVSTIQDFAEPLLEIVATDSTGANDR